MIWCYSCDEEILLKAKDSAVETKKSENSFAGKVLASVVHILNPLPPTNDEDDAEDAAEIESESEEKKMRAHKAAWENFYRLLRPVTDELHEVTPHAGYNPGLCGLRNFGNTCYMNSALQALNSTTPLRRLILGPPGLLFASSRELRPLLHEYEIVYESVWSGKFNAVTPKMLHAQIGRVNPLFRGYAQHDSQELLRTLLDSLHEVLKRSDYARYKAPATPPQPNKTTGKIPKPFVPEESSISDIFEGKLLSTVTCGNCHRKSNTMDRFFDLSLSIPTTSLLPHIAKRREMLDLKRGTSVNDGELVDFASESGAAPRNGNGWWNYLTSWFSGSADVSIESCLHGFCLEDELTGQDRYRCEHCKVLHDATKSFSIAKLPQVLCLHFKRFKYDLFGSKVSDYVRFPLVDFDMSDFCASAEDIQEALTCNTTANGSTSNGAKQANGKTSPATPRASKRVKKGSASAQPMSTRSTDANSGANGGNANGGSPNASTSPRPLYDLYAVICHSGSLHGGHYYAYAKHPGTREWHEFNDSSVVKVDEETVASAEAYVLFYEQQTSAAKAEERELMKAKILTFLERYQTVSPGPETPHVSLTWLMKWINTNEPGPMNAPSMTCEHNVPISLERPHSHAIPLPTAVADHFKNTYGGSLWYLRTDPCTICEERRVEELRRLKEIETKQTEVKSRREQEHSTVERLGRLLKEPGEIQRGYYFIDQKWISGWLDFAKGISDVVPGPIDNAALAAHPRTVKYRVVNTSVWQYLHSQYGGGPELWRKTSTLVPVNHSRYESSESEDDSEYSDSDSSE